MANSHDHSAAHKQLILDIEGLAVGRPDLLVWKNDVGYDALLHIKYGLPGSTDLLLCRSIIVPPAMVGCRVGMFGAIEAKTGRGKPSPNQINFGETVLRLGGLYKLARSVDDAREVLG